MRPNYTMVLALVFVSASAFSMTPFNGDDVVAKFASDKEPVVDNADVKKLYEACLSYAEARDSQGNLYLVFSNKLRKRVETRMSDANVAEMDAYRQIALEWLIDNEAKLQDRQDQAVLNACFFVKALLSVKSGLPSEVLTKMTKVACYRLVRWLDANSAVTVGMNSILAIVK